MLRKEVTSRIENRPRRVDAFCDFGLGTIVEAWPQEDKEMKLYLAIRNLLEREEGASLAEYGLLVALIAVVCVGAITALGTQINTAFGTIVTALTP